MVLALAAAPFAPAAPDTRSVADPEVLLRHAALQAREACLLNTTPAIRRTLGLLQRRFLSMKEISEL